MPGSNVSNQRGFASDNYAGIHPAVLEAIGKVNVGHQVAYGEDSETSRFQEVVKELFGPRAFRFSMAPVQT
jgi:threonine aldolase